MDPDHADYAALSVIRDGIYDKIGGEADLPTRLPQLIKSAVDFVLDPPNTGRTRIGDLDKVEKTFIGLKIEHYIREWLGVPKGLHRDLLIGDIDVDIKHTIGSTWMIPPETYRNGDPCLLIATAKFDGRCSLGLVLARPEYLNAPNRDQKRSISTEGRRNIMWLARDVPYPRSHWDGVDMERFWELRKIGGGTKRAAQFFRENVGKAVHRSIIQALLHDQRDYMKRVRGNGGARDELKKEGILLLSGMYDQKALKAKNLDLAKDEFVAIQTEG
jgi:hypothetical protein